MLLVGTTTRRHEEEAADPVVLDSTCVSKKECNIQIHFEKLG